MTISVGDWVRSYSQGVWQVVRVVPPFYETRYALDEPQTLTDRQLYVLKRLASDKWKPALAMETAEAAFVKPLNKADDKKLQKFLADHPALLDEFTAFTQPLSLTLNLPFALAKKADFKPFKQYFEAELAAPLAKGLTSDAILKAIAASPYASAYRQRPTSATLQFACPDLQIQRKHFLYRELNVLNF